ncbi:hypothetical protein DFP72DRAFT_1102074 [Ephemerocybe angulata]|uniref:Uncharacterized protein n=1 Tax=Ephemerocybe angulata TaxID=980116 RepID=A0A8H6H9W3_9AGAR|nr:hypothetical protein DFP72DRAFT_1102074 [Tulosesus angulatus]
MPGRRRNIVSSDDDCEDLEADGLLNSDHSTRGGDFEEDGGSDEERRYGAVGRGYPQDSQRQVGSRPNAGRSTSGPGALQGQGRPVSNEAYRRQCDEVVKRYQLRASDLEDQLKTLKMQVTTLKNQLKADSTKGAATGKSGGKGVSSEEEEWGQLASKFVLMAEPFINPASFRGPPPKVSILSPDRYLSSPNRMACIRAELFDMVPPAHHKHLQKEGSFYKRFKEAGDAFFRQRVMDVRRTSGKWVFQCLGLQHLSHHYAYAHNKDRAALPEFKKLLAWPAGSREERLAGKFFLPIHFPDGILDFNKVFQVEWISLICRSWLHGPASVEPKALENPNWRPGSCCGKKWGISSGSPGLFATAAMAGVFMHNSDPSIDAVGSESKFPYLKAQQYYKEYFITALMDTGGPEEAAILDLFAWHNGRIFPDRDESDSDKDQGDGNDYGTRNAMNAARLALKAAAGNAAGGATQAPPSDGDFDEEYREYGNLPLRFRVVLPQLYVTRFAWFHRVSGAFELATRNSISQPRPGPSALHTSRPSALAHSTALRAARSATHLQTHLAECSPGLHGLISGASNANLQPLRPEPAIKPRERIAQVREKTEADLARQKDEGKIWDDAIDNPQQTP